jgi:hypothetical protein
VIRCEQLTARTWSCKLSTCAAILEKVSLPGEYALKRGYIDRAAGESNMKLEISRANHSATAKDLTKRQLAQQGIHNSKRRKQQPCKP